jgi:hypothetical protein
VSELARRFRGSNFARIFHAFTEFVAGLFKNRCRGVPDAMAAAGARSEQHIISIALASILISLGFNVEAGWPAIARPGNPVAADLLGSVRWPVTMSISS